MYNAKYYVSSKDFSHIAFILLKIQPSKMHISPPLQYGANGHGADDIFQMHIRCKCFLPEVLSEKGTTFLTTHFCSKSSPPTLLRQMKMGERCASLDNAEVFFLQRGKNYCEPRREEYMHTHGCCMVNEPNRFALLGFYIYTSGIYPLHTSSCFLQEKKNCIIKNGALIYYVVV